MPLSDEAVATLADQSRKFVGRFGREPCPDDPISFDGPVARKEFGVVRAMKAAGPNPAYVHAYEKTGLLVSRQNVHLIPEVDLNAWRAAIEEYQQKHRGRDEA